MSAVCYEACLCSLLSVHLPYLLSTCINVHTADLKMRTRADRQGIHEHLKKCKDLGRMIKNAQVVHRPLVGADLEQTIPVREICDELVQLYVNNFESTSR